MQLSILMYRWQRWIKVNQYNISIKLMKRIKQVPKEMKVGTLQYIKFP